MSHQRRHLLEKLQVQIAAAAALAVAYFFMSRLVRPWEPGGTMVFIPAGDYGRLAVFAVLVWLLSVGCAILTLSARPDGALLAVLIGAAGFALKSGPARLLLQSRNGEFGRLFVLLAGEALVMSAVVAGAIAVIFLVRAAARRVCPRLVWTAPAPVESPEAGSTKKDKGRKDKKNAPSGTGGLPHVGAALLMEMAVALILLLITFRSTDRGQIAFALAASFFLSALAAHQTFPIRISAPFWVGPILMAALVFILGWVGVGGSEGPAWYTAQMAAKNLPFRAALPIDWLTFGGAGAVAGFWLSSRINEAKTKSTETPGRKD